MTTLLLIGIPICLITMTAAAVAGVLRWRDRHRAGTVIELRAAAGSPLDLAAWAVFYRSLYAVVRPRWKEWLGQPWLVFELFSENGAVKVRCWCPLELEGMISTLLRNAVPGIQLESIPSELAMPEPASRARLRPWREHLYPLGGVKADMMRQVVRALAGAPSGIVQIVLSPETGWQSAARARLDQLAGLPIPQALPMRLLQGAVGIVFELLWKGEPTVSRPPVHPYPTQPPPDKASRLGYRTEVRLRVSAPTTGLARRQMQTLAAGYRGLDGTNGLRSHRVWLRRRFDRAISQRRPAGAGAPILVPEELAELFHVPAGGLEPAPVRLAPVRLPQGEGKLICHADDENHSPAVLTTADARHHVHIVGPTGAGKSTLLANMALDDIRAERGLGVIDPEGDLVRDLLERIPREHWGRVCLIDPSIRELPVGLNAMECEDFDMHELVTDQLVTVFRRVFDRYWGPRTEDVLRAAVLTLLHQPGATLCDIPSLLQEPHAWQHVIARVQDSVGLGPWWDEYLAASPAQRTQWTGPLFYKLRAVLLRSSLRNIFGQSRSTVDLAQLMDRGGILLVSLSKGLLGEETSQLTGAMIFARLWQAAIGRASRPEAWRPDFTLYPDEFWSYLHVQNLGDVLVQARKYHLSLVLPHQHLGQIAPTTRESLMSNARTRIVWQTGQDDAHYLAREYEPLTAYDLRNLQAHQVAVRLSVHGHTEPPFTGITRPAPPSLGAEHATELIRVALARYGRPRDEVEAELARRLRSEGFSTIDALEEA